MRWFLLAATTIASAALKDLLDELEADARHPIQTKVWDRFEIEQKLLSDRFSGLLMRFFSDHSLIRNFPSRAIQFLKAVAEISIENNIIYNAIEMLRQSGDFSWKNELEITRRRDNDKLYTLYFDDVRLILKRLPSWGEELLKLHVADGNELKLLARIIDNKRGLPCNAR